MTRQDSVRAKLLAKVFNTTTGVGKSVTLKSAASTTYNTRGEIESSSTTDTTITIVPYNQITQRSHEAFGALSAGDLEAAVPYTVTINIGDLIYMESTTWKVIAVQPNWLPDNVVTIVRLTKVVA
jgi:hypothetical protein